MKTPLEAVLFDLDGTLLDTAPDFAIVVNQLLANHNKPPLHFSEIRQSVSQGSRALVTLAFSISEADQRFESLRDELLELYSRHLAVETVPFPGIDELLGWLDNESLPWGIVTNKPRAYAQPLLDALKLSTRCSTLVCPDDVAQTKPHAEPMLLACQQASVKPEHTVYLGDHRRDIEAGRNAAMKTIAVNYGYIEAHDPSTNWQADYYVNHASEIQALLLENFSIQ